MWCRWCKACVGRTWRGEKVGQRHQEGHHLLRVPCLGDTWAPRSLRVPVGTDSERRVAIWCCIWCRDLDFLRLFFIVSQPFIILCNLTPCLLFTLFLGSREQQSGININGKEKIRLTVSTCPCRICICFMPTMQLTHSGSTAWLRMTGGQAWWRHRTKSWTSMMKPAMKSSQSHWGNSSQTARLTNIVDGAWRKSNGPPYGGVLETPAHWQPWRVRWWKNTERTSSDDTGSLWKPDERSCIHPQNWCDSSDSTSEESLPWEGGELWNSSPSELAARRIGQISRVLEVLC